MAQDRSSKEIYLGSVFSDGLHIDNFKNYIPGPTQRTKPLVTTLTADATKRREFKQAYESYRSLHYKPKIVPPVGVKRSA